MYDQYSREIKRIWVVNDKAEPIKHPQVISNNIDEYFRLIPENIFKSHEYSGWRQVGFNKIEAMFKDCDIRDASERFYSKYLKLGMLQEVSDLIIKAEGLILEVASNPNQRDDLEKPLYGSEPTPLRRAKDHLQLAKGDISQEMMRNG